MNITSELLPCKGSNSFGLCLLTTQSFPALLFPRHLAPTLHNATTSTHHQQAMPSTSTLPIRSQPGLPVAQPLCHPPMPKHPCLQRSMRSTSPRLCSPNCGRMLLQKMLLRRPWKLEWRLPQKPPSTQRSMQRQAFFEPKSPPCFNRTPLVRRSCLATLPKLDLLPPNFPTKPTAFQSFAFASNPLAAPLTFSLSLAPHPPTPPHPPFRNSFADGSKEVDAFDAGGATSSTPSASSGSEDDGGAEPAAAAKVAEVVIVSDDEAQMSPLLHVSSGSKFSALSSSDSSDDDEPPVVAVPQPSPKRTRSRSGRGKIGRKRGGRR
jgi:hypothetical protein